MTLPSRITNYESRDHEKQIDPMVAECKEPEKPRVLADKIMGSGTESMVNYHSGSGKEAQCLYIMKLRRRAFDNSALYG
jgi:hypothetical protein